MKFARTLTYLSGTGLILTVLASPLVGGARPTAEAPKPAAPLTARPAVPPKPQDTPAAKEGARLVPAVKPKPLSPAVNKGLAWLAKQQLESGAWGQGEESVQMGRNVELMDKGNVADTCIAALALLRAGNTPSKGPHAATVSRALDYVMRQVERADDTSLSVTDVHGTRVQSKIGPHVDTFMSSMLLAEAKGGMPDPKAEARLERALAKVLRKIERNQKQDGTWEGQAWAPVLSQALGAKGLNRAAQAGAPVEDEALDRSEKYAQSQFDGQGFGAAGSAGIDLYAAAASTGAMADAVNTRDMEEGDLRKRATSRDQKEAQAAKARLADAERSKKAHASAEDALLARLADPSFVSGFGSNGGEEFLSYMLVSESLVTKGGEAWKRWDTAMANNLTRVQNGDGSWTGHHCITGRTFVTASALLVLTADRAPVPLAAKMRRG